MKAPLKLLFHITASILIILIFTSFELFLLYHYSLEAVLISFIALSSVAWGWVVHWLYTDGRITFSHILTIWLVLTGTILGGCSYYLSFKGISYNLEELSRYVMVETVAAPAGYFIKSAVEHVFPRNLSSSNSVDSTDSSDSAGPATEDSESSKGPTVDL